MARDPRLTRRRFATGALAIGSAACVGRKEQMVLPAAPPDPGASFAPPAEAGARSDLTIDPDLAFHPVADGAPPPRVIWSWTTSEQAAELRKNRVLYTRTRSPTLGRGHLFDVLAERAKKGDRIATRLGGRELAKGRFGWHTPWPTILGAAPDETYGLELLRIELRRDAWFARVRTSSEAFEFVDLAGAPVESANALASFDRVAGILFENDIAARWASTGTGGGGLVYREIYVGNEARVETWSHRTASMLAILDAHAAELTTLRDWLAALGGHGGAVDWQRRAARSWRRPPSTTLERYFASLAFLTEPYTPDAAHVSAIVAKLVEARFTPAPLVHPR
jgi:hypothetical protein